MKTDHGNIKFDDSYWIWGWFTAKGVVFSCLFWWRFFHFFFSPLLHMLTFTAGVICNAEFAFLLGTHYLAFCTRTIFKEISKDPISNVLISNVLSLKTMEIEKPTFLNRQKRSSNKKWVNKCLWKWFSVECLWGPRIYFPPLVFYLVVPKCKGLRICSKGLRHREKL